MGSLVRRRRMALGVASAAAAVAVVSVVGLAASSAAPQPEFPGSPPPEWSSLTDAWPAHNFDLSNSRNTTHSDINASNVATLHPIWHFHIPGSGPFGNYASTPVVSERRRLPAGPQLERLRARSGDREAEVEAPVRQPVDRAERGLRRLRPRLRRDGEIRLRAESGDRRSRLEEADRPDRARRDRHGAATL